MLKIGWASRDVSTQKPVSIPGQFHTRVSEGVQDPVTVNVLVLDSGADSVIFISGDFVVIRTFLVQQLQRRVAELNPEIPAEKIIFNCTHTHAGPNYASSNLVFEDKSKGLEVDPATEFPQECEIASGAEYREFLLRSLAEAMAEAWDKRAPGGVAWGYGYATTSHSRRVVYFDDISKRPGTVQTPGMMVNGHGAMYGNTNDDNFSHYEAGTDTFINLLYTFDESGKLTGAIINVPCPSQNSEAEWKLTADFWHDVRQKLRARYGNIHILAQCAAAGDLAPRIMHYRQAQERRFKLKYGEERLDLSQRKDIAERIAAAFTEVLDWAKKDIRSELTITHIVESVELDQRVITAEEAAEEAAVLAGLDKEPFKTDGTPGERLSCNSRLAARRNRSRGVLARYEAQKTARTMPVEIHVVRVGDIAFASNPFELFMDYMHRIQARSPFEQTFIVQLTGTSNLETFSYLATERGEFNRGYSASIYCNLFSSKGGQQLVEATVKTLKEINQDKQ